MSEQPIWKITLSDDLDPDAVEELLPKAASWEMEGTGLQVERVDVVNGSTYVFVSGSEADAQRLLERIGEFQPKLIGSRECEACTVEVLHRMEPEKPPRPKRR
ncbi:MAG TPA: hypothetical protein VJQ79_01155 [Acidimicrobiia bacterium]|nr:hypothetical protein [Acidimicrobiia bacterium]